MKQFYALTLAALLLSCSSEESGNKESLNPDGEGDPQLEQMTSEDPENDALEVEAVEETDELEGCNVDLRAYLMDPDTEGKTNIRKTPGGEVIMQIGGDGITDYFLYLVDQKDGWFKLEEKIEGIDEDYEIPGGVGWIHGSVCYVDTRNYGGQELFLYSEADESSEVVYSFSNEEGFHITAVCGDWAKVYTTADGKKVEGWIQKEWLCGNPLTTCS